MRICIIGAGSTGHAIAAYLMDKGMDCILCTRSEEKAAAINRHGITSEGAVTGTFLIPATVGLHQAVEGADLIVVMTTANAHKEVAVRLKPLLANHQRVVIFNSNWGAYEFKQILNHDIEDKNLTVAETSAQLFLGSLITTGRVNMSTKEQVFVSATNPEKTRGLIEFTRAIFPQFKLASSIIETTMSSTNPVIHVPIALLNLARIENAQHFMFYREGVSRMAVELILKIDQERVAAAKALGSEIDDVLTSINSFWEVKHTNLYDALTKNAAYLKAVGPQSLEHRFITEDIPYGIAPIAKIGDLAGIETPATDSLMNTLTHVLPPGLICDGVVFSKYDLLSSVHP